MPAMGRRTFVVFITLTSIAIVSCQLNWTMQVQKICETGDPAGTNHTLVHALTHVDCARACNVNFRCNFASFHGNECAMYPDDSMCGAAVVGSSRTVVKVDPNCDPGWYRYSGSCYLVVPIARFAPAIFWGCRDDHAAKPVTIGTAGEGLFVADLLRFLNFPDETVWLSGVYDNDMWQWWESPDPWVYDNWGLGEPDGLPGDVCVSMNISDATWRSESCSQNKIGVCKKAL